MLTLSALTKSFGGRTLFSDVALQVNRGDRIGLVGPNGAGKTTLFSIVTGDEASDGGQVILQRGASVGYLPQEQEPRGSETVLQIALSGDAELASLRDRIRRAEEGGAEHDEDYPIALARFSELRGYEKEALAKKILKGLSFKESDFERAASEFSGGWVMRAHLARLLVQEPDLLMLDEPTNHLDLEALLWFQEYLKNYPGAILMISHDREFLNQLVGSIIEIRQGKIWRYKGAYDDFIEQRLAQEDQQMAAFKNQQREIDRLMVFVNRFRAKNTKATQAQSKLKQIERMEKVDAPTADNKRVRFRFPQPQRSGQKVMTLKDIHHAYGQNVVYQRLNYLVERGQRIALVGPNGAGKSTLLKLLAGVLPVQRGERELGHNVKVGYFSQYRTEMLDPSKTVLEEAYETPQQLNETTARTVLGAFLFRDEDVFKKVAVLSGGEKSRLALVKLLLDPPNFLLMDEPTTHLDIPSIESLVMALEPFQGTIVFISHDVHFLRSIADRVTRVDPGVVTEFAGGYDYYVEKRAAMLAEEERAAAAVAGRRAVDTPKSGFKSKEQKRAEAEARQAVSKKKKEQQGKVDALERQIAELEKRQIELTEELEKPETYADSGRAVEVNRELAGVMASLSKRTKEWEEAAHQLAELLPN